MFVTKISVVAGQSKYNMRGHITAKKIYGQDLAIAIRGDDSAVTDDQIMAWEDHDLYEWLEIAGFEWREKVGWVQYVRDMRNKQRHPLVSEAPGQLPLFSKEVINDNF